MNKETKLLVVAIMIALLNIISHLLLSKYFTDFPWLEVSLASIPFIMMLLCFCGSLRCQRLERKAICRGSRKDLKRHIKVAVNPLCSP
ncbi:hypothetical protein VTH8203_01401 [Vibrio thalassae]|uniref:Uncharacterized protein n=1 Tax=Vibrio thalassae TaxID=1243014 RepID=A0A240EGV3_9VIBR|nr:hypothetical protein [Vibrio thalassae]SNX47786.1 hypothetical protein VTH8203_01401 [Vibrio thalassae]